MIKEELLRMLCCPLSKAGLVEYQGRLVSTDINTRRAYRIKDGIPVLLIEESEELPLEDWQRIIEKSSSAAPVE